MDIRSTVSRRLRTTVAAAGLAGAGLVLAAGPALAAPGATSSGSAAGLSIGCVIDGNPVQFTTTGGTFHAVNQLQQDATAAFHFTGTESLQGVTATDGVASDAYQVVGSSWYGGTLSPTGSMNFVSTDEFNILGPDGGRVADVHAVETVSPSGVVLHMGLSDCLPVG